MLFEGTKRIPSESQKTPIAALQKLDWTSYNGGKILDEEAKKVS